MIFCRIHFIKIRCPDICLRKYEVLPEYDGPFLARHWGLICTGAPILFDSRFLVVPVDSKVKSGRDQRGINSSNTCLNIRILPRDYSSFLLPLGRIVPLGSRARLWSDVASTPRKRVVW